MSAFCANGRILISVNAEIYGAWAVSESIESLERNLFAVTHIATGKRLPPPFVYEDVRTARRLAQLANEKLPEFEDTPLQLAFLKAVCLEFREQPHLSLPPDAEGTLPAQPENTQKEDL